MLANNHLQVSPEMLNWIEVRTLAQPFKNIHRAVLKPLLCYSSCVLGFIVLLEGEPAAHSEAVNILWKRFLSKISMYPVGCIHLSFNCNQAFCPCS